MHGTPIRRATFLLLAALLAPVAGPLAAQQLTVQRIFGTGEFTARGVAGLRWSPDGSRFTFIEERVGGVTDLVAEDARTGERRTLVDGSKLVPPGELRPVPIEGYEWSPDGARLLIFTRSQRVWRLRTKGVYFVLELASGELRPLSTAFGWQQFAKFSPDGGKVGFVRENDLFVVDLETMEETRLTHDGSETVVNGTFDWVYEEELGLRDGWRWSPDGRRIAFWRLDQTPVRTFHLVDEMELYPRLVPIRYPKAGEANSLVAVGVVDVESGGTVWVDLGPNPDVYVARMEWAASPDELVIQRLNRRQDRIDVLLADASTGESRLLFREESPTWVEVDEDLIWLDGGRRFLWTSERDGYDQIFLYRRDGSVERKLTPGTWDVDRILGVDASGKWVYFEGRGEGPLQRHLYRVRTDGGGLERLTREPGTHAVDLAPGAAYYVDAHSRAGVPPTYTLHDGEGREVRLLVDNVPLQERLDGMELRPPEFFTFTTSDGVELNGWMIRPPDFDPQRRYPVLMYVYGGPGSQTVTDAWWGS